MNLTRTVSCAVRFLFLCIFSVAVAEVGGTVGLADDAADPPAARSQDAQSQTRDSIFEAPVRLMVGDEPLNASANQAYPSPAVYDVDGDGQVELVVGDILGSLNVYENQNESGKGDPVWSKQVALKAADGSPIRVSNW